MLTPPLLDWMSGGGGGFWSLDLERTGLTAAGAQVAEVDGVGVFIDVLGGQAHAQAGPLLRDDDAVLGIAGLVAGRAGKACADLGRIYHSGHAGDVLRALIVHTADVIAVEEHGEGAGWFVFGCRRGVDVVDVEQHAVYQAAGLGKEQAARALDFIGGRTPLEHQPESERGEGGQQRQPDGGFPEMCAENVHERRDAEPYRRVT